MEKEGKNRKEMPCPAEDDYKYIIDDYEEAKPGVLLSHDIIYYATTHQMIIPFDESLLKPAAYKLRLGEDYAIGGKLEKLHNTPGKDELVIPPFQVAIVSTKEKINLPRFIIARWNLRVDLVYQGLLWTGALQVDPGWCGQLYCPIYNLSNETVVLKLDDPIVTMDFVKTTPFKNISKKYPRPPKLESLKEYNYKLKSGLFTEAGLRIDKIEEKIEKEFEKRITRVESFTGLSFASVAVLFTALAIFVTSRSITHDFFSPPTWFILWIFLSLSLSIFAIYITLQSKLDIIKKWFDKRWLRIVIPIFLLIFIVGSYVMQGIDRDDRQRQTESLQKQIKNLQEQYKAIIDTRENGPSINPLDSKPAKKEESKIKDDKKTP